MTEYQKDLMLPIGAMVFLFIFWGTGSNKEKIIQPESSHVYGEFWHDTTEGKDLEWVGITRIVQVRSNCIIVDEFYLNGAGFSWGYSNQVEPLSFLKFSNLGELKDWPKCDLNLSYEVSDDRRRIKQ